MADAYIIIAGAISTQGLKSLPLRTSIARSMAVPGEKIEGMKLTLGAITLTDIRLMEVSRRP